MHTQAQSALIAPGKEVTALRELFGELLADPRNVQRIADLMSGADIRYHDGTHPLIGRWAPDFLINGTTRLAELLRAGRPLLLDLTDGAPFAATMTSDRIDVIAGRGEVPIAVLIRPDGYVAWAAERDGVEEQDGLRTALARWFGVRQERPLTNATR